ncbi:hypothetical protein ACOSQ4_030759 [Xanthoceras sorbifolium]
MAEALCNTNPTIHVASRHNHNRPWLKRRGGGGGMRLRVTMLHNNQQYWASINQQIEAHLRKVVTIRDPVSVFEPMHHLVFAAPRDTAPALCVAACELVSGGCSGGREQAVAAAAALHVMHAASFSREHLPLSDRPSLIPRPRPMIHHVFGPNIELLTVDGMIPFGLELVAKLDDPAHDISDRILRVIVEITRAIGSQGVVNGQYSELLYNQWNNNGSSHVESIQTKEGGLHACGAACGAILGGGSEEEIEKLRNYGLYVEMIQGMLRLSTMMSSSSSKERSSMRVEVLRNLALKELEGFDESKVEVMSGLIEANLSHV